MLLHRPSRALALVVLGALTSACETISTPDDAALDATDGASGLRDVGTDAGPPPEPFAASAPLVDYVDPTTGTGGLGFNDIGSVHPGPQWAFGMIRPGPDTVNASGGAAGFLHCSGFHADDEYVSGISHTRLHGVGVNDQNVVAFMPALDFGPAIASSAGLRSHYDRSLTEAEVGHLAITLDDARFGGRAIALETTAARRVAMHRVRFPEGTDAAPTDASIVFDLAHTTPGVEVTAGSIRVLPEAREVEGSVTFQGGYSRRYGGMTVHFVARFDAPFASFGTWAPPVDTSATEGVLDEGATERTAATGGAFLRFDVASDREVGVAVAISYLDVARARMNLDAEAADLDFDRLERELVQSWESRLAQVELVGRYEHDFRVFYTALYHAFFMPTLATEADGHYRGIDGEEHVAEGFTYYTDFSLWDTYRTLHPLITLLAPELQRDFVESLIAMADVRGTFPRWVLGTGETGGMLGDPAVIVLADSLLRGVDDFDLRHAYELALASADADPSTGRGGMEPYLRLGYVTAEHGDSSTSETLEFAYADHAVAVLAGALGEEDDAARFYNRSHNYQRVYDAAQGFFAARHEDGSFDTLNPERWNDTFAEGNAWQYLWLAPQDVDGLAETLGGRDVALERLHTFFDGAYTERRTALAPTWYWQGNEPDIHAPYLFALWGEPAATAEAVSWVRRVSYDVGPEGLPGNDDSGTMSAWYVFSALGFYPLAATEAFVLGSPRFNRATVHLPAGDLTIVADAASDAVISPTSITLDGATLDTIVSHATLARGGELVFTLSEN